MTELVVRRHRALPGRGRVRGRRIVVAHLLLALSLAVTALVAPTVAAASDPNPIQPSHRELQLRVGGRFGVPVDAEAVVLNVTIDSPSRAGWLVVHPCGTARPVASNLNFSARQTVPNLVVAKLGTGGKVCLYGTADAHVIVDVAGYFPAGSDYVPSTAPSRVFDTRRVSQGRAPALLPREQQLSVQLGGEGGIPMNASAAVLNVTVADPSNDGWLVVHPCGNPRPVASNLNFAARRTVPNLVVAKLGVGGKVCLYGTADAHVIVDVAGHFPAGSDYVPTPDPVRAFDTRRLSQGRSAGSLPKQTVLPVGIAGRDGVPADATTAVLNVTAATPTSGGWLVVYPCGAPRPVASNLNFSTNQTVPNLVFARLGTGGRVCIYGTATMHVVVDVAGYVPAGGDYTALVSPVRLLDTRVRMNPGAEAEMLVLVNARRATAGSGPLVICESLGLAAQRHSLDQAARSTMSHVGSDGSSMSQRVDRAGYVGWTALAENVAAGYRDVPSVVAGWMGSTGHRTSLLNPAYTHVGFGLARSPGTYGSLYWTQVFGRSGIC